MPSDIAMKHHQKPKDPCQPSGGVGRGTRVMVTEAGDGLRADLETLYRRDFAAVLALVYGLSGSRSAAEEITQDAFAAAHRSWSTVGGYDDPARGCARSR